MKAKDISIGTRVFAAGHGFMRGAVIANQMKDGDEVVVVEFDNGTLVKANVNDLSVIKSSKKA